jgi:hypothetical protein
VLECPFLAISGFRFVYLASGQRYIAHLDHSIRRLGVATLKDRSDYLQGGIQKDAPFGQRALK